MSALADLGWEAYPNEGVSIVQHNIHTLPNKHLHLCFSRADTKKQKIHLITSVNHVMVRFYFQGLRRDSELATALESVF